MHVFLADAQHTYRPNSKLRTQTHPDWEKFYVSMFKENPTWRAVEKTAVTKHLILGMDCEMIFCKSLQVPGCAVSWVSAAGPPFFFSSSFILPVLRGLPAVAVARLSPTEFRAARCGSVDFECTWRWDAFSEVSKGRSRTGQRCQ